MGCGKDQMSNGWESASHSESWAIVVGISEMHESVAEIITQTHMWVIYLGGPKSRREHSKLMTNSEILHQGFRIWEGQRRDQKMYFLRTWLVSKQGAI